MEQIGWEGVSQSRAVACINTLRHLSPGSGGLLGLYTHLSVYACVHACVMHSQRQATCGKGKQHVCREKVLLH